jgi:hypothetical protein
VGPVGPDLWLEVAPPGRFCPQRRVARCRYILMPESPSGHNNTIGLTRFFAARDQPSRICNFTFDTPMTGPYKRGSHGERGVPETSRVIAAQGFMTLAVPSSIEGLDQCLTGGGRALYALSVRKGIRRRRRTFALQARMFSPSLVRTFDASRT